MYVIIVTSYFTLFLFSFTALAEAYIDFHLGHAEDLDISKETREALCEKRLAEGWFLYSLIEIKQRYLIEGFIFVCSELIEINSLGPLLANIDDSLSLYNDIVNKTFVIRWGSHKCSKPGCGNVLVFDGGVKVGF